MEFITNNYVWFIVGVVILLMTLVGYVAERTDFGHRKVDEIVDKKKKKQERIKKDKEKLKNSSLKLNDVVYENGKAEEKKETNPIDDWASPFDNPVQENTTGGLSNDTVTEDLTVPLEEVKEENQEDSFMNTLTEPLSEMKNNDVTPIEEDLNAPLPEMKTPTVNGNEDLNAPLPEMNVPTFTSEVSEVVPEVASQQDIEEMNVPLEEVVPEKIENDENLKAKDITPTEAEVPVEIPQEEIKEEKLVEEDNIWKF